MVKLIEQTTLLRAAGEPPKTIEEFIGRMNSGTDKVSIARMRSPQGWKEPGQTPEFDEYTVVITGTLRLETKEKTFDIKAGQAVIVQKGEWVRYSTPLEGEAEYIAVCLPAFSPEAVQRDEK